MATRINYTQLSGVLDSLDIAIKTLADVQKETDNSSKNSINLTQSLQECLDKILHKINFVHIPDKLSINKKIRQIMIIREMLPRATTCPLDEYKNHLRILEIKIIGIYGKILASFQNDGIKNFLLEDYYLSGLNTFNKLSDSFLAVDTSL